MAIVSWLVPSCPAGTVAYSPTVYQSGSFTGPLLYAATVSGTSRNLTYAACKSSSGVWTATNEWVLQSVDVGAMTDAQYNGLVAAINATTSAVNTKGDAINTSIGTNTTATNTASANEIAKVDSAMNYGVVGLAAVLFVVGFAMGYRITFRRGGL